MKKWIAIFLVALLLTGCVKPVTPSFSDDNGQTNGTNAQKQPQSSVDPSEVYSDRDYETDYSDTQYATVTFQSTSIQSSTNAVRINGTTAEIIEQGTYVLTGNLEDGQLVINAEEKDKIQLVLENVSINSQNTAPIYVKQADKVFITLADGTENTLSNGGSFPADDNIDGVIFSKTDLTLNGTGSLEITSPAGHGVVCKDDLVITGGNYTVSTAGHGISGKDSVSIDGGAYDLTAGKDGIHAENTEDTAKGRCYITGGTFAISSEGDGVAASGAMEIVDGIFTVTAGGGNENGNKANSGNYGDFMGPGSRPGRPRATQTAATTDTDSASMKGLKAAGVLTIHGGSFTLDTADDGVHSNADLTIGGGTFQIATGDDGFHADERLEILSGTITVTKSYEGLEGHHIAVSGGEISLIANDDGLNAAGGNDSSGTGGRDQMFGGPGGMSSGNGSIVISGGKLYIEASGDGIDANGTLEITGGYTVVCGPTKGDTATLDYDKTGIITGGTFIGTGAAGMAQSFSSSQNQGVLALQAGTVAANIQVTVTDDKGNEVLSFAPKLGFNVIILSSPQIQKGESYTITVGTQSGTFQAK